MSKLTFFFVSFVIYIHKSQYLEWAPSKMICAHGDRIVDENPGAALIHAWTKGVLPSKSG